MGEAINCQLVLLSFFLDESPILLVKRIVTGRPGGSVIEILRFQGKGSEFNPRPGN